MRPSIERIVNEYARLRKEAFALRRVLEDTPELRNAFLAYMDEDAGSDHANCPAGDFKSDLVVATIMDEFSSENWTPEFCNIMLSFDNWEREIDYFQPDLLFVESAWNGNHSQWSYAFEAPRMHSNARAFDQVIETSRKRGIPTLFWNKEDPLHFEKFIDAAGLFDVVCTTDSAAVPRYITRLGHERVFALPFAAQPVVCNPVRQTEARDSRPFFAGSYYVSDHGTRTQQMDMLFDVMLERGGVIYDRSYHSDSPDVQMPSKYQPICVPPVPFDQIVDVYKEHSSALNVNSVTQSPTMMSRRVFEVLACSTPVISTPSDAIENLLPDVVDVVATPDAARDAIDRYTKEPEAAERRGHLGYRKVLSSHTYNHRLASIVEAMDSAFPGAQLTSRLRPRPGQLNATVLMPSRDPARAKQALLSFAKQTHRDFEMILLAGAEFEQADIEELRQAMPDLQVLPLEDDRSLAELATGLSGEVLICANDRDLYGPEFLSDLLLPLRYTEADIVGKASRFVFDAKREETCLVRPASVHRYVQDLKGSPLLLTGRAIDTLGASLSLESLFSASFEGASELGLRIYSCDPYNLLEHRELSAGEAGEARRVSKGLCSAAIFI